MSSFLSLLLFLFTPFQGLQKSNATVGDGLVVIVNTSCGITSLSADEISDYFFKKKHEWPDHTRVRFIDQKDSAKAKKLFNQNILKKSTRQIELFWIEEKNSGQSAPIQAPSDELVISLVGTLKGSIGYVSSDALVEESANVKQVSIQE